MLLSKSDLRRFHGLTILGLLLVSVFVGTLIIHPIYGGNGDWWNYSWRYRKSITIDHSKVADDLTDFPVLIDIIDGGLASEALISGDDIVFADYSGNKLDHEIELYDNSTGHLTAWVRVPNLSSTEDTILYMYYGNPSASNQENPTGVWDSNYVMVQHLEETSGTHFDSTVNGNDGTAQGGLNQNAAGKIDGADDFDGGDDYVDCGNAASLDLNDDITLEAWFRTSASGWAGIVSKRKGSSPFPGYFLSIRDTNEVRVGIRDSSSVQAVADSGLTYSDGSWHHAVGTIDKSSTTGLRIYVDGAEVSYSLQEDPTSVGDIRTGEILKIGAHEGTALFFDGAIDEVRVSNVVRSVAWISTECNNEHDPSSFYTVGTEETAPPKPPSQVWCWWDADWQYRKMITVDHNKVDGDLMNFSVLTDIVDSDVAAHARGDGNDIVFTDYYGNKLDHEIELYSSGHLVAWVQVPSLSSTEDTILYIYYGNPSASNQENPTGVWDSNYVMVQHLDETSGTHYDSTTNNNDGTPYGGVTQDATGKIDGADSFDGVDDYVTIPDSTSLSPSNEITISMWVEATDGVAAAKRNTNPGNEYSWETGIHNNEAYLRINANEHIARSTDLPSANWLVSSLYDGTYLVDGHDVVVGPDEKYAYFLTFGSGYLSVINITDPKNPSRVASTNTGIGADGLHGYNAVVSGDMIYIAAYGGGVGRIVAYNISDSTNPVYKGHLQSSNYDAAHGIKVDPDDPDVVCMSCYRSDSVVSFNVSDPTSIVQLDLLIDSTYLGKIHDINVKGDYLYTTSGGAAASVDRFTVVDISDPNSMSITSSIQDSNALHDCRGVDISGNYAYVAMANEGNAQGGLTIVNIADPNNPSVTGYIKTTETYYTHDVHYIGDNKVVGCLFHPDGVALFNVTDKNNPTVIGTATDHTILDLPHDGDVFASGKYSIWACNGKVTIVENLNLDRTIPMFYIVGTYSKDDGSDQIKMYVNGNLDGTHTYSSVISDTLVDVTLARRCHLGAEAWYPGIIDEARISNIARSAEWISTEYNNQHDPSSFYTIGAETKPAELYIDPPVIEKTLDDVCTTFQVNVTVEDVIDLWGFDFNLTWDNSLITLANLDFNTTLDNMWGPSDWFVDESMNVTGLGYYELAAVSTSTGFTSTEATPLATLTFHVEDPPAGETLIHFSMVKLSNSHWQCIPVETTDGTYRISKWYWYIKPPYPDYAPSGMPDFDERQWGTYNWTCNNKWSHCGPVAVANSLWWMDSKYESLNTTSTPVPPPTISDNFTLVTSYKPGIWDDHDPQNVQPLIEHLAWLMDCDGMRTGQVWCGTYVNHTHGMEGGLAQYLSWSGVNPLGDVNGDGVVDMTDYNIVNNAMGSAPGTPNWNLAADIYPATTTYPPTTNNIINASDLNLVLNNLGKTGLFYEHTIDGWKMNWEFFTYIEEEVERSQDVVLLLGFYIKGTDYREGGHYITVAGVNSTTAELLISNPCRDDFEAGKTPGRCPVPHQHVGEPPYTTHNNASLVSHDAYTVVKNYSESGYDLVLDGYFPQEHPWEARIEYAVVTSPKPAKPDLEIIDGQEHEICDEFWVTINVTHVVDLTDFNFTILYNHTYLEVLGYDWTDSVLDGPKYCDFSTPGNVTGYIGVSAPWTGDSGLLLKLLFHVRFTDPVIWKTDYNNVTAHVWFHYAKLSFYEIPNLIYEEGVTEEEIIVINKTVHIKLIQGDIDGDGTVDIFDLRCVAAYYDVEEGDPDWPDASAYDLNGDKIIDIFDLVIVATNFGYT